MAGLGGAQVEGLARQLQAKGSPQSVVRQKFVVHVLVGDVAQLRLLGAEAVFAVLPLYLFDVVLQIEGTVFELHFRVLVRASHDALGQGKDQHGLGKGDAVELELVRHRPVGNVFHPGNLGHAVVAQLRLGILKQPSLRGRIHAHLLQHQGHVRQPEAILLEIVFALFPKDGVPVVDKLDPVHQLVPAHVIDGQALGNLLGVERVVGPLEKGKPKEGDPHEGDGSLSEDVLAVLLPLRVVRVRPLFRFHRHRVAGVAGLRTQKLFQLVVHGLVQVLVQVSRDVHGFVVNLDVVVVVKQVLVANQQLEPVGAHGNVGVLCGGARFPSGRGRVPRLENAGHPEAAHVGKEGGHFFPLQRKLQLARIGREVGVLVRLRDFHVLAAQDSRLSILPPRIDGAEVEPPVAVVKPLVVHRSVGPLPLGLLLLSLRLAAASPGRLLSQLVQNLFGRRLEFAHRNVPDEVGRAEHLHPLETGDPELDSAADNPDLGRTLFPSRRCSFFSARYGRHRCVGACDVV